MSSVSDDDAVESSAPQVLQGHIAVVFSMAWAPDGRSLASGSDEGHVRVWPVGEDGAARSSGPQMLQGLADQGGAVQVLQGPDAATSTLCDGSVAVTSDGYARKPHCAGEPSLQGMAWDLGRCAHALCIAAGDDTPTAAAAFKADLDPSSGGNIAYWEVPRDLW
eukprot:jgi/Tetstr1/445014/TSEL_032822.t1